MGKRLVALITPGKVQAVILAKLGRLARAVTLGLNSRHGQAYSDRAPSALR